MVVKYGTIALIKKLFNRAEKDLHMLTENIFNPLNGTGAYMHQVITVTDIYGIERYKVYILTLSLF